MSNLFGHEQCLFFCTFVLSFWKPLLLRFWESSLTLHPHFPIETFCKTIHVQNICADHQSNNDNKNIEVFGNWTPVQQKQDFHAIRNMKEKTIQKLIFLGFVGGVKKNNCFDLNTDKFSWMVGFVLWVCLFVKSLFVKSLFVKSLFVGEHLWVLILVAVFVWKQVHIFIFNNPPSFGSFSLLLTTLWTRKNTDGALLFWSRVWIFPQRLTFFFFFQLCLWCLLFCCFSVLRHQKLSFRFMLTDKSLFVKLVTNLALKVQQSCLFETQTMELWSCHAIRVITPSPLPMGEYQSLQPKRTHTDNRSFPQARLAAPVFGHFILVTTTHALLCAQHVSFNGANCESLKMFKVKTNGENTLFRSFQNATRCLRRHEQQNWEECQQLLFGHCLHQPNVQNRVLCVHSTNGNCLYPCHWHLQHSQFNRNHLHETGISHVNVKTNKQVTDLKWQLDGNSSWDHWAVKWHTRSSLW